jgi:hypothetical protein
MTRIQIDLPDATAQAASKAGLLAPQALAELLNDALRRAAGRKLLAAAKRIHNTGIAPMSDEEIVAEVKAVRAERRAREAKSSDAK